VYDISARTSKEYRPEKTINASTLSAEIISPVGGSFDPQKGMKNNL
jgi:hypothetical protein